MSLKIKLVFNERKHLIHKKRNLLENTGVIGAKPYFIENIIIEKFKIKFDIILTKFDTI